MAQSTKSRRSVMSGVPPWRPASALSSPPISTKDCMWSGGGHNVDGSSKSTRAGLRHRGDLTSSNQRPATAPCNTAIRKCSEAFRKSVAELMLQNAARKKSLQQTSSPESRSDRNYSNSVTQPEWKYLERWKSDRAISSIARKGTPADNESPTSSFTSTASDSTKVNYKKWQNPLLKAPLRYCTKNVTKTNAIEKPAVSDDSYKPVRKSEKPMRPSSAGQNRSRRDYKKTTNIRMKRSEPSLKEYILKIENEAMMKLKYGRENRINRHGTKSIINEVNKTLDKQIPNFSSYIIESNKSDSKCESVQQASEGIAKGRKYTELLISSHNADEGLKKTSGKNPTVLPESLSSKSGTVNPESKTEVQKKRVYEINQKCTSSVHELVSARKCKLGTRSSRIDSKRSHPSSTILINSSRCPGCSSLTNTSRSAKPIEISRKLSLPSGSLKHPSKICVIIENLQKPLEYFQCRIKFMDKNNGAENVPKGKSRKPNKISPNVKKQYSS